MNKSMWAIGVAMAVIGIAARTEAAMVMPLSVEDLTKRAEKIFVGTCTKVEHITNTQGIPVLEVTFAVTESLKGTSGKTIAFQQLDPAAVQKQSQVASSTNTRFRARSVLSAAALAGVPTYTPGEEVMLFLARPGKLGLTAPVGLHQGKMPLIASPDGKKMVTNTALRKTALTANVLPEQGKSASYDQFVTTVRALVKTAR
jgi:hypothetical protein